jgi:hypothetical protein
MLFDEVDPVSSPVDDAPVRDSERRAIEPTPPIVRAPIESSIESESAPSIESTAPISIPPIDWAAEAERAARDVVARQSEGDSLRSLDAHPEGMDLPPPDQRGHHLGDTEHLEGGEIIDWVNDKCYYTKMPPPGPDLGPLRLMLPVCKR